MFDLESMEWRSGKPRGEGYEKRLYEVAGPDPMIVEKGLSKAEGAASAVIREIVETERLPDEASRLEDFLSFVALQAARSPAHVRGAKEFLQDVALSETGRELSRSKRTALRLSKKDLLENDGVEFEYRNALVSWVSTMAGHETLSRCADRRISGRSIRLSCGARIDSCGLAVHVSTICTMEYVPIRPSWRL